MACPLCRVRVLPGEDRTILGCCKIEYHAGCMHRRFLSGLRACPKCGKEPALRFDDAPGSVPARMGGAFSAQPTLFSRVREALFPDPTLEKTIPELLAEGWTWEDMRDSGWTKENLFARGLDLATARARARELNSVFGFDSADWARLRDHR